MAVTRTFRLGGLFVYDHWARDLPEAATAVSRNAGAHGACVMVELNQEGYDELLSDATYYANEMSGAGFDDRALVSSAARVAKALKQAGPPTESREETPNASA